MNARRALIIDYGGVLTTPAIDSYRAFCDREGIDLADFRKVIRTAYREPDPHDPIVQIELGTIRLEVFEARLAQVLTEGLGKEIAAEGLSSRIMGGTAPEQRMIEAVRRGHAEGVPTAMLSNSWGDHAYPEEIAGLFDAFVISGRVGLRKPDPRIFELTLDELGLGAAACVFVDDARPNCEAAQAMGMDALLHRSPEETIPWLEDRLGVPLTPSGS